MEKLNREQRYLDNVPTGQYGRLYIENSFNAHWQTFNVYVLSSDKKVVLDNLIPNEAILVGTFEDHEGRLNWLHRGKWIHDFAKLVDQKEKEKTEKDKKDSDDKKEREKQILSTYQ